MLPLRSTLAILPLLLVQAVPAPGRGDDALAVVARALAELTDPADQASKAAAMEVARLASSRGSDDSPADGGSALRARQSNPLNPFVAMLTSMPPFSNVTDSASSTITSLQTTGAPLLGVQTSADDVQSGAPCGDVSEIGVRGTAEPGNLGLLVLPAYISALRAAIPDKRVRVQGVEYAASVTGYLSGGGDDGVQNMIRLVNKAAEACPTEKIGLTGYSQGAQVVHKTWEGLSGAVKQRVNHIVTFGDPKSKTAMAGAEDRHLVICHPTDGICDNGVVISMSHLTYGALDAGAAAEFAVKMLSTRR